MQRAFGIVLIIISASSFGTLAIFARFAYAAGLDTFTLLFLRFAFAAVIMLILLFFRRESLPVGRSLAVLIGMGAVGYAGQAFSYLTAIKYASAGLVALLLYLYPSIVALLSAIFLKERFTWLKILALALATMGAGLTADPQGGETLGILLAVSAAVIYSVYILVGADVMKKVTAFQSSTVIFASAGIVYAGLTFLNGAHFPINFTGWGVMAAIVVVATVVPVVTFLAGLQLIGPTNASMLSTIEPVVTVLLAAWLFGEKLSPVILSGGGLILAAVVMLTLDKPSGIASNRK